MTASKAEVIAVLVVLVVLVVCLTVKLVWL